MQSCAAMLEATATRCRAPVAIYSNIPVSNERALPYSTQFMFCFNNSVILVIYHQQSIPSKRYALDELLATAVHQQLIKHNRLVSASES
jgi:hypothetical protein